MNKKEKRLSPRVRKLIKEAKDMPYFSQEFTDNAVNHLKSIDPQELNLYDRQKLGRELRRAEHRRHSYHDLDSANPTYNVSSSDELVGIQKGFFRRILEKLEKTKGADNDLVEAQRLEMKKSQSTPGFYCYAGERYMDQGRLNKALYCYEHAINTINLLPQTADGRKENEKLEKRIDSGLLQVRRMKEAIDERKRKVGMKNANLASHFLSIIAVTGLIAGLFFLSSNITGNVIASLNQTSSNLTGGILFTIGLIASFIYFKRK
ncbi:MAG: hypothetical protein WCK90_00120 [archaeon]